MHPRGSANEARRLLVPSSVASPLGILDVSTLQYLLNSPSIPEVIAHAHGEGTTQNDRPASSELARVYGGYDSSDAISHSQRPRRRSTLAESKPKPRHRPPKLAPMGSTAIQTVPCGSLDRNNDEQRLMTRHHHHCGRHKSKQTPPKKPHRGSSGVAGAQLVKPTQIPLVTGKNPVGSRTTTLLASRNPVNESAHPHFDFDSSVGSGQAQKQNKNKIQSVDKRLGQEIQWIHAHFPVRRLANAHCSLKLRRQLFAETLHTNFVRGALRDALHWWKWTVIKTKEWEASRLQASHRLMELFGHATRDHVAHRFAMWQKWVQECQEMELLAAQVTIQQWYFDCLQKRMARRQQTTIDMARALAIAVQQAARIQRAFRTHRARRKLHHLVCAATKIQRFVRATYRKRYAVEQANAARQLEELFAQVQRDQRLAALIGRSRHQLARKVQKWWRQYASWRAQLVVLTVASIVDQVEFFAAVMSIQSHIRGYQCRFRMKRKINSAACIQKAWRQYHTRGIARKQRQMVLLSQKMAASCLQRTFRTNRERKHHRAVMQQSTKPMYLRALLLSQDDTSSFRERYHIAILKSAAFVVQSTWTRYVRYKNWKANRDKHARRIQKWLRKVWILSQWHQCSHKILEHAVQQRKHQAVLRLQKWARANLQRKKQAQQAQQASLTNQLVEMLSSVMTIQRYYRFQHDKWRWVTRMVLQRMLPVWRQAAITIQKWWRKRVVVQKQDKRMGIEASERHTMELVIAKKQEMDRHDMAARTIQKARRRYMDKRNGKIFLKRYKLLFHKELRRKQQRQVIHGFLEEKQGERAKKLGNRMKESATSSSSAPPSSVISVGTLGSTCSVGNLSGSDSGSGSGSGSPWSPPGHQADPVNSPMEMAESDKGTANGDDPDVVRCWSEEYQCHYWFNSRTGQSTW